jgi:hypothetical protein
VLGSRATYGLSHADWVLRLGQPPAATARRVYEVDVRPEEALLEQLRGRELHLSLVTGRRAGEKPYRGRNRIEVRRRPDSGVQLRAGGVAGGPTGWRAHPPALLR